MKSLMSRLGVAEDEPIENRMITKSIETAQTKIEGFNFDARKHVLEYDDVMNHQRKIVYGRRRAVLVGDESAIDAYLAKISEGDEAAVNIIADKKQQLGDAEFYGVMRRLILQAIDMFWVDHLEMMDYMRGSVNLRAYGQRDPLVEYKREGLKLFKEMEATIGDQIIKVIPNIIPGAFTVRDKQMEQVRKQAREITSRTGSGTPISSGKKEPGRNDPCPCGAINPATNKVYKYKQCGLINAPHHRK